MKIKTAYTVIMILTVLFLGISCSPKKIETVTANEESRSVMHQSISSSIDMTNLTLNLNSVKELVLNPEATAQNNDVLDFINEYNKLILSGKISERESNDYLTFMLQGCDDQLNGCHHLSFLSYVTNTKDIFTDLAQKSETSDIKTYYRYLKIANSLKNSQIDIDLYCMYLKHANEYEKTLTDPSDIQSHHTFIDNILQFRSLLSDRKEFNSFIENYKFSDATNKYEEKILRISIEQNNNTSLINFINEEINKLEKIDNFDVKELVYYEKTLKINTPAKDVYYFLISSAFNGRSTVKTLSTIWQKTDKDTNKFSVSLRNYVNLKFLQAVRLANSKMAQFYEKKEYTNSSLFQDAYRKSFEARPYFSEFQKKLFSLKSFAQNIMLKEGSASIKKYHELEDRLFLSLPKNIKFIAVYPQMMILMHNFAKKGFHLEFQTIGGSYKVQSDEVIRKFFEGYYEPFFQYGNNNKKIMAEQMIYSFYYALNTGLFKDFNIDYENEFAMISDFILQAANQMGLDLIKRMQKAKDYFNATYTRNLVFDNFQYLCQRIDQNSHNQKSGYIHHLSLSELRDYTLIGQKIGEQVLSQPSYYNNVMQSDIERIRLTSKSFINKIEFMISMFDNYMKDLGVDANTRKVYLENARSPLITIKHESIGYLTLFWNKHLIFSKCAEKIYHAERNLQMKVLATEEKYLRNIYRRYNTQKNDEAKINDLNEQMQKSLDKNFQGLDHIADNTLNMHQVDFLMRTRNYLRLGLASYVQINVPSTEQEWNENEIYQKSLESQLSISLEQSEDDFINEALEKIVHDQLRNKNGLVQWLVDKDYQNFWLGNIESAMATMSSVFRLGRFEIYQNENCALKQNDTNCKLETIQLDPHYFVQLLESMHKLMNLTDEDVRWLQKTGRTSRLLSKLPFYTKHAFAHPLTQNIDDWNLFDYVYYSIKEPRLGALYSAFPWDSMEEESIMSKLEVRKSVWTTTQDYYTARSEDPSLFIFEVGEQMQQEIDNSYRKTFDEEINHVKSIGAMLEEIPAESILHTPIRYTLEKSIQKGIINPELIKDFEARVFNFHEETNGFFKKMLN